MTEAGADIGWRRRYRTSDIGAAALITLGGLVAKHGGAATGWRLLAWLVMAAGAALAVLCRDRWLERSDDGAVWLGSAWWWLRPFGARRVQLRPERVVIEPAGSGWWARRKTILSIANDVEASPAVPGGPRPLEVLERWIEPSCQEYAQSVGASLARWLGVSTGGTLAPFEPLSPEVARAKLRASLAALKYKYAGRSRPRRARVHVSGDTHVIESGRRWFEVFWRVWVTTLGAALASLWWLRSSDRPFAVACALALPVGAVLMLEGLRGVFPGRVVTRVGPHALTVERAGLSHELHVQVLFSDLAALTFRGDSGWWQSNERFRRVLVLALRDQVVVVQAADLGLRPRDLPWFVGVCREAIEAWLDRSSDGAAEAASSAVSAQEKPPSAITTHRPDRYRPSSILSVFGSLFPRLASLAGVLLVLGLHLLRMAVERDLLAAPSNFIVTWNVIGYDLDAAARYAALIAAGLVAVTLTLMSLKLMWSAPRFTGLVVLAALTALISLVQVVGLAEAAPNGIRVVDLCRGSLIPPRVPITAKGGDTAERQFDRGVDNASSLVEVQGLFGARYMVAADEYARICGGWKARLAKLGGDPHQQRKASP